MGGALQRGSRSTRTLHVIVSNSSRVKAALVALGPRGAAVTCSLAAHAPASAPPPVPQGTPWVHLALANPDRDPLPALHPPGAAGAPAATQPELPTLYEVPSIGAYTPVDAAAAAAAMRELLQQQQGALCAVLCSCLRRVSLEYFGILQQRLLQSHPWLGEDFPDEILTAPSLARALPAGFDKKSTWLACEQAAALTAVVTVAPWGLLAQIGLLALVRPAWHAAVCRRVVCGGCCSAGGWRCKWGWCALD